MVNLRQEHLFYPTFSCFYHLLYLFLQPLIQYKSLMEKLLKTFCRYDMVCDNPSGIGLELHKMPEFFDQKQGKETEQAHIHGFYEIVWFQDGSGSHYVDFSEYEVAPNTVFFISPGQIHSFDHNHQQKGFVIKICSELLSGTSSEDSIFLKYNVFNAFDRLPYYHISAYDAHKLSVIVNSIQEELAESGNIGHKEYLQSLIEMFIIRVERSAQEEDHNVFSLTRTSHRTFLAFRKKLEENYATLHTVKDYAMLLNISTKTLTSYVSECSAYTPLEMINSRIILEAKRLLRYSNLMVKEIAFRLGFEDPSYFVKFFKRQVRCSPAEYRDPIS